MKYKLLMGICMHRTLFLIFNHQITDLQKDDAVNSLGTSLTKDLPRDLKELWSRIPPEMPEVVPYLEPIRKWLRAEAIKGDYVLIQGDFGACFIIVNFALAQGLIPVYSTTEREAVEEHEDDGTIKLTHQFKHHIFRRYGI